MNATMRSRTGLALPMVLGAITLIGTLIAGVMYLATQDYRVGANTLNETRAEAAAEMGLNRLTTDWDQTKNTTMPTGDTLRKNYTDPTERPSRSSSRVCPGPSSGQFPRRRRAEQSSVWFAPPLWIAVPPEYASSQLPRCRDGSRQHPRQR